MTAAKKKPSWRDVIKVHPAAKVFPRMTLDELRTLAEDIKTNGLKVPVVVWKDDDGTDTDFGDEGTDYLLDGRNRLDALELAGYATTKDGRLHLAGCMKPPRPNEWAIERLRSKYVSTNFPSGKRQTNPGIDPPAFIISANIHRRHLTPKQRVLLTVRALRAGGVIGDGKIEPGGVLWGGKKTRDLLWGKDEDHRKTLSDDPKVRSGKVHKKGVRGSVKGDIAKVAETAGVSMPTARKYLSEADMLEETPLEKRARASMERALKRRKQKEAEKTRNAEPRQVKVYLDALKRFRMEARKSLEVLRPGEGGWSGDLSPESKRFLKRRHTEIRAVLEEMESRLLSEPKTDRTDER